MLKQIKHCALRCQLLGAALMICGSVACSEQILPQLVAQIASLDHDHGVALSAGTNGIDLILTHDRPSEPQQNESHPVALPASHAAHVIHLPNDTTLAKQTASVSSGGECSMGACFCASTARHIDAFVPKLPLAYSRPPPERLSILSFDRSTLLLI